MNIGLFGGTFDPIHHGHLALARAAKERFELGRIYFVPANVPPHKQKQPLSPYFHRYAMVVLATMGEKALCRRCWRPREWLRAGGKSGKSQQAEHAVAGANYSIDTVRRLKESLKKIDRLFFLIGMDAFADIAHWHQAEALLRECEFIVASRPGYSLADVANALPEKLRPARSRQPTLRQTAGQRRPGAEWSDHSFAGQRASAGFGHGDPRSGDGKEAAAQICGCRGRGVHQEGRAVY